MFEEEPVLTARKRWIMQRMREGEMLSEGSSTYAVAMLGKEEEVELRLIEEMEAAGWIYVIGELEGKRSWKLTKRGLDMLAE